MKKDRNGKDLRETEDTKKRQQEYTEELYREKVLRPGADCGSYHELIIAKFRLKLKKLGKTTDHSGMTKIKSLMITQ